MALPVTTYVMRDHRAQKRPARQRQLSELSISELQMRLRRLSREYEFIPTEEAGKPLIREMDRIQDELARRKESRQ